MQLLSRKEAAALLNVSIKTIDRLRKSKQLTTVTIGRRVMVTQESIELCQSVKSHASQAETDCITSVTMTDSALGVFLRAQANKRKHRLSLDTGLRKVAQK